MKSINPVGERLWQEAIDYLAGFNCLFVVSVRRQEVALVIKKRRKILWEFQRLQ